MFWPSLVTLGVILYETIRFFHFRYFYSMFRDSQMGPRARILELDIFIIFVVFSKL